MQCVVECNKLCSAWSLCDPGDLVLVPVPTYARLEIGHFSVHSYVRLENWAYSRAHLCQVRNIGSVKVPIYARLETLALFQWPLLIS
jgi:hypothetical protein